MGENSFLRDFRARMLSSRWAMSRSILLRFSSFGSPAEHLVSAGKRQLDFRSEFYKVRFENKGTYLVTCNLF